MIQGFVQWKKMGRHIQYGQKGLYIYAPKHKITKEIIRDKMEILSKMKMVKTKLM